MPRKYLPIGSADEIPDYTALPLDKPVAVYYRQSTHEQIGNVSTAIQTIDMPEQLKRRGWKDEQVILIDADAGVSGSLKIHEREGMSSLFDMILNKEIGAVATVDEDRLFRDITMIQADTFIDACKQNKVIVITPFVTYTFHHPHLGQMFIKQFRAKCEAAAEYLDQYVVKRLGGARRRIILEGKWAGQRIPTGLMADMRDKNSPTYRTYVPFEPFDAAVLTVFQTFVDCGGSARETRRLLKERGFRLPTLNEHPVPDGYRVNYEQKRRISVPHEKTIKDIVTNVAYRGDFVYRGVVIRRNNHPAIVPAGLFVTAFNLASPIADDGSPNSEFRGRAQRRAPQEHLRTVERPLLEGRLWVMVDGEMRRASVYYRRRFGRYDYTYDEQRVRDGSTSWTRDSEYIDKAIRYFLKQRLSATAVRERLAENLKAQEKARETELRRLNAQIKAAERQIAGMAAKILGLKDANPALLSDLAKLDKTTRAEHAQMLAQRDKLNSKSAVHAQREAFSLILEWAQEKVLPNSAARQLVAVLIDRVEVTDFEQRGGIKAVIYWADGVDPTTFDLQHKAARGAWEFDEVQALKHYMSAGATQIVLSAVLCRREWGAIRHAVNWRYGAGKVRGAGLLRRTDTFRTYCRRVHDLQIDEESIRIVALSVNEWAIAVRDIARDETIFIGASGEVVEGEWRNSETPIPAIDNYSRKPRRECATSYSHHDG